MCVQTILCVIVSINRLFKNASSKDSLTIDFHTYRSQTMTYREGLMTDISVSDPFSSEVLHKISGLAVKGDSFMLYFLCYSCNL